MTFGQRLYELRKEKNLSQEDLAEQLGVSRQSVSRWENGTASPDFEKTVRLSELFGVTTDYLLKGEASLSAPPAETPRVLPTWRKILAIVFGVLSGISTLYGLFFGGWWDYYLHIPLPLLILGLLMLFSRKRTLLRSIWVLYLFATNLFYISFSWHWSQFFLIFRQIDPAFKRYIPSGAFLLLLMLSVVIYTAWTLRKNSIRNPRIHLILLCMMPPAYLLWQWISHLLSKPMMQLVLAQSSLYQFLNILLGLVPLTLITAFAILLAQQLYKRKK